MIYMALFGVGKLIFGRTLLGLAFLTVAAAAAAAVYWDLHRRGWRIIDDEPAQRPLTQAAKPSATDLKSV
jgi:hypothetical protein